MARDPGRPASGPANDGLYRGYATAVLLALFILSTLDRQIVNILAEPIKRDLRLADWQLGLMSGLAFAILYATAGVPIARLAERGHRPRVIGASVAVWSLFTFACGISGSFVQLLAGRVGVGVGEAGLTPSAMSLIMDYAPPRKRASTLAAYHMGSPLGALLGLALGGVLTDLVGWRLAFVWVGLPGVAMAALAAVTLREPRRGVGTVQEAAPRRTSTATAVTSLWRIPSYRLCVLGTAFQSFALYGQGAFVAPFFFRTHAAELLRLASAAGLQPAGFLGLALGGATGIFGAAGVWAGGRAADRYSGGDGRAFATIPALGALLAVPSFILAICAPSAALGLVLLAAPSFLSFLWLGPVHVVQQSVAPLHLRATATAVLLFVLNMIGLGLGPLTVGVLSDVLAKGFGLGPARGVQFALVAGSFAGVISAALFWRARRWIPIDLAAASAAESPGASLENSTSSAAWRDAATLPGRAR